MSRRHVELRFLSPILFATATLALAGPAAPQLKPEQKASFVLAADRTAYDAGSPARVAALVTIESGWHVNSHQPTFEWLIPTELTLELPAGWKAGSFRYPAAKMQRFAFEKEPLAVYDGDVVILAALQVPPGTVKAAYPLKARLRYQACNREQCLPPVTAEAGIQLTVGPGGRPQHQDLFSPSAGSAPRKPGGSP